MFEPKVFREQMYRIEESTCDIVGTLRRPAVIRLPENCSSLSPLHISMGLLDRKLRKISY